ncbi:MAG: acyltransferase [Acidimicrobiales bacterium]
MPPERPDAAPSDAARRTFADFDGFRAIAAVSIVVFHVSFLSGIGLRHRVFGLFLARLDVGVPLFFVISGFLLYRPFATAHLAQRAGPGVRRFLARRLLRIVPAYWVVFAVVAILGLKSVGGVADVAVYLGFLQIYDSHHLGGGISQAWSLCTEITFYLAIPVYGAIVGRLAAGAQTTTVLRRELLCVGIVYVVGIGVRAAIAFGDLRSPVDPRLDWLPATMDLFALGMAMAIFSAWTDTRGRRPGRWESAVARGTGQLGLCWAAAAGVYVVVATVVFRTADLGRAFTPWQVVARQVLYGIIGVLVIAPGAVGHRPTRRGPARAALRSRPAVAVGVVSYSVYLTHNAVLDAIIRHYRLRPLHIAFPSLLVATAAGTAAVSTITYVMIERPAMRIKRWVGDGGIGAPGLARATLKNAGTAVPR